MAELTSGDVVAKRFRLDHKLGEGGMGTVWAATHTVTGRTLALKLLKARAKSQQKRFIREARAASAVDHPNVVRIEDVFELDDGMPVMVLELLEGESLSAKLKRDGRLAVETLAELMLPVLSAVGTAHAAGIVHRDLKPENIFLCQPSTNSSSSSRHGDSDGDGKLRVKVLDFGIAKLTLSDELASTEGALTKTGALVGTPYYMSPEQASGEQLDHRTDIWSLGLNVYEALSGVLPTRAETVGGVLKIVMTGRVPPLESLDVELPEELTAMVTRMLALDPENRPADLREVAALFQKYSDVEVPEFGAAASSVVPLGLVTDDSATADEEALAGDPHMDTNQWLVKHGESGEVEVSDPGEEAVDEKAPVERADPREQPAEPAASTTAVTSNTVEDAGASSPKRSRMTFVVAAGLIAVAALYLFSPAAKRPGQQATDSSSTAGTAAKLAVPKPLKQPKLGLDAIAKYRTHAALKGAVLKSASYWETAALDFHKAALQPGAPKRWQAAEHFATGQALVRRGKHADAVASYRKSSKLEPDWATAKTGLSSALLAAKEIKGALEAAQEAQRLDPGWWRPVLAAARALNQENKHNEAIQEYRRALALEPKAAIVLAELALAYHAARLDSEAMRYGNKALEIDPDMVAVRLMLAELALETNDGDKAVTEASRAVAISPLDIGSRLALGDALALTGKRTEALAAYRELVKLLEGAPAPTGLDTKRIALVRKLTARNELPPPRVPAKSAGTQGSGHVVQRTGRVKPREPPRTGSSGAAPVPAPRSGSRSSAPPPRSGSRSAAPVPPPRSGSRSAAPTDYDDGLD